MYDKTGEPILFTEHITIPLQNNLHKHSQHTWHECYIQIFFYFKHLASKLLFRFCNHYIQSLQLI